MSTREKDPKKKKAKFFEPDTSLKKKVGPGLIKKETVNSADRFIENNKVDFIPMAQKLMKEMRGILDQAQEGKLTKAQLVEEITKPVMQLKGNAATFKYPIITMLMNTLLNFLETLEELDKDALTITEVNYKALRAVLSHNIRDNKDQNGYLFAKELENAIKRYRKKHK